MTEAVQTTEAPEVKFLGLDKNQFAIVIALTSVGQRLPEIMSQEEVLEIMDKLVNDANYTKLKDAIFWTSNQRNRLMQLSHTVAFALSLINQVEDNLIVGAFQEQDSIK